MLGNPDATDDLAIMTESVPATSEPAFVDELDDVFGSAPPSPSHDAEFLDRQPPSGADRSRAADPSDIPRLRSIHVTNGYREGIAASKEQHIQAGFDEGYGLGGEIGIKAGLYLGVLEGLSHYPQDREDAHASWNEIPDLLARAQDELSMSKLLGPEYVGPDGVWLFDVAGQDKEGGELQVTFADVAAAHPVLRQWEAIVKDLIAKLNVKVKI